MEILASNKIFKKFLFKNNMVTCFCMNSQIKRNTIVLQFFVPIANKYLCIAS